MIRRCLLATISGDGVSTENSGSKNGSFPSLNEVVTEKELNTEFAAVHIVPFRSTSIHIQVPQLPIPSTLNGLQYTTSKTPIATNQ